MINQITSIREKLNERQYYAILVSTIAFIVVAPLFQHDVWSRAVFGVLGIVTLITVSVGITSHARRRLRMLGLALLSGGLWATASFINVYPFNTLAYEVVASVACLLFFGHACFVMLRDILTGSITTNRICGAICVYILVGFCFAMLHMLVALCEPASYSESAKSLTRELFKAIPLSERYPAFVYFSFSTLSTVGYGDIFPISRFARTLSWLEAVMGQFYMAVLVARLVGLHIATMTLERSDAARERDSDEVLVVSPPREIARTRR